MNDSITKYIYAYVRRRPALCAASVYMARYGYWLYLLFGIVEWLRPGTDEKKRKARMALLEAIFSVCYSSLFSCFIGRLWKRKRPFVAHTDICPSLFHKDNPSFPSNHTMNAVTSSMAVAKSSPLMGLFLFVWAFFIGLSRVACGLHYVSDILGGAIMAIPGNRVASRCIVVRFLSSIMITLWDIKVGAKRF